MPFAAKSPCSAPGCPEYAVARGRCETHALEQRRQVDADRPNATARGYGWKWRNAARAFLRDNPLCRCEECVREKRTTPADTVDHIKPHRGNHALFWDRSNWRPMAAAHHNRKTATHDGGFGRKRRTE